MRPELKSLCDNTARFKNFIDSREQPPIESDPIKRARICIEAAMKLSAAAEERMKNVHLCRSAVSVAKDVL